jgi:hypothetical protein
MILAEVELSFECDEHGESADDKIIVNDVRLFKEKSERLVEYCRFLRWKG